MKKIFLCCCFLLAAANAFASGTYYVSSSGGNDSKDGLTPATAWKSIAKVNKISNAAVYFYGPDTFSDADFAPSGSNVTYSTYGTGKATIAGASSSRVLSAMYNTQLALKNLKFAGAKYLFFSDQSDFLMEDCEISLEMTQSDGIIFRNGSGTIRRCNIRSLRPHTGTSHAIFVTATKKSPATVLNVEQCNIVSPSGCGVSMNGDAYGLTAYIEDNSILGCRNGGIASGAATNIVYAYGNYIAGCFDRAMKNTSGDAFHYGNNIFSGNYLDPLNHNSQLSLTGAVDEGGNRYNVLSKYASPYTGMFVATMDDTITYAQAVADYIPGFPVSAYVIPGLIPPVAGDCRTFVAQGNEIGVHSWSHTKLNYTYAYSISSTNTSPTVSVVQNDADTGSITLACAEGGNKNITLSWTASDPKSIADLQKAISGSVVPDSQASVTGNGWTINRIDVNVHNPLKLACLKDTGGAKSCSTARQLLLDKSAPYYAFWKHEIGDTADWIQTYLGVIPTTMAYPYGGTDYAGGTSVLETWMRANTPLKGARTVSIPDATGVILAEIGAYHIGAISLSAPDTYTDDQIHEYARFLYAKGVATPQIITILSHSTSEFSLAHWKILHDDIVSFGGQWKTFASVISEITTWAPATDPKYFFDPFAWSADGASSDWDGDGMPNEWEIQAGLDPLNPEDALLDLDGDGLNNLDEYRAGTDPANKDTDSDGVWDGEEVSSGTDPLNASSYPVVQTYSVPAATGVWLVGQGIVLLWVGRRSFVSRRKK